ncbi:branched-chain amino acid ABC transporter permease [Rhodococcus opacus]
MPYWYDTHIVLIQSTLVSVLLVLSVQIPLRCGVFSFAGIGSYGIGAYTTAIAVTRYGHDVLIAIFEGVALAAVIGYLLSLLLQRLSGLYLGMASIAFVLIISVIAVNGGTFTGGAEGVYGVLADISTLQIATILLVVLICVALTERGRVGRRIEAVREDPELAQATRINVDRVRRLSFVASGALGAAAGGINVVLRTTISPTDFGFTLVVVTMTMIVVGGVGTWIGAVIGAVVFTWLPTLLAFVGDWKAVIYGVIVVLMAVWVPGGVTGVAQESYRRQQARRRARSKIVPDDEAQPPTSEGELVMLQSMADTAAGADRS